MTALLTVLLVYCLVAISSVRPSVSDLVNLAGLALFGGLTLVASFGVMWIVYRGLVITTAVYGRERSWGQLAPYSGGVEPPRDVGPMETIKASGRLERQDQQVRRIFASFDDETFAVVTNDPFSPMVRFYPRVGLRLQLLEQGRKSTLQDEAGTFELRNRNQLKQFVDSLRARGYEFLQPS